MNAFAKLAQSTIGKKVVMAVTGIIMVGWLFIHMAGNMIVFAGEESFNHYAHWIQSGFGIEPAVLWVMRAGMLASVVAHIWAAIGLSSRNRAARPVDYSVSKTQVTSYAARFMLLGGIVLLTFLVFHLATLTVGVGYGPDFTKDEAFQNLVAALSNPLIAALYIVANLSLFAHLKHGVSSGLQTLGVNHPRYNSLKSGLSLLLPLAIAGGNVVIALCVLAGVVTV